MPSIAQRPYATEASTAASRSRSTRRTTSRALAWSPARRGRRPRARVSTASILTSVTDVGRGLSGLVEVGLEHLERGGCRRGAAVAAVLDHGADGDRRVVGRPVA